jgi:hypothetical protein
MLVESQALSGTFYHPIDFLCRTRTLWSLAPAVVRERKQGAQPRKQVGPLECVVKEDLSGVKINRPEGQTVSRKQNPGMKRTNLMNQGQGPIETE